MYYFLGLILILTMILQAAPIGGFDMSSLEDERNFYRAQGWTWLPSAEPHHENGYPTFQVTSIDVHGDSEGDDLWTNLMMYQRTSQQGYLDRATAWAQYFKTNYRACPGGPHSELCFDMNHYYGCHMYGWGLVAWYEYNGDAAALAEAESLGAVVEELWTTGNCSASHRCNVGRGTARQLLLATRLAEVTGKSRWVQLRDKILDRLMTSPNWSDQYGTYFYSEVATNYSYSEYADYSAGDRLFSPFQLGVMTEAFAHAYRVTQRQDIKDRMVSIANFVYEYGLHDTYQYVGSAFGIVDGKEFHNYAASEPITRWDPVYTTSLVNTLVWGYKFTGDRKFLDQATHHLERGTKGGNWTTPLDRRAPDTVVHHFVDANFFHIYFAENKGELQYTWALFDPQNLAVEQTAQKSLSPGIIASPNPFSISTRIKINNIPKSVECNLKIYSINGKIINRVKLKGNQLLSGVSWDASNLPPGIYIVKLAFDEKVFSKRLILM